MNDHAHVNDSTTVLHHLMFDVDGTLVHSLESDADCFAKAVSEVTGWVIDTNWSEYKHATDVGILKEHLHRQGRADDLSMLSVQVKRVFTEMLALRIQQQPVDAVAGASEFLQRVIDHPQIVVSIATGGWWDTALLKLDSAGIDVSGVPHASSDDHYSRTGIMEIAQVRSGGQNDIPCSYFGDGIWDKVACEAMRYNFVQVGGNRFHHKHVADYTDFKTALALAGVS